MDASFILWYLVHCRSVRTFFFLPMLSFRKLVPYCVLFYFALFPNTFSNPESSLLLFVVSVVSFFCNSMNSVLCCVLISFVLFDATELSPKNADKFQAFWLCTVALWGRCVFLAHLKMVFDDTPNFLGELMILFLHSVTTWMMVKTPQSWWEQQIWGGTGLHTPPSHSTEGDTAQKRFQNLNIGILKSCSCTI